jgi:3-hydroxyisobutyrate dehydrogenase
MERIGFIGLGVMGFPMSKRLLQSGYELYVHDIDSRPVAALEALGAQRCETPKDVSSKAGIVISMLPNPAATRRTILGEHGAINGFSQGSIYIDMSTSDPILTREISEVLRERSVHMLDAPVSGGIKGAAEGSLTIMVGGSPKVLEQVGGILACLSAKVIHVGEIGAGHTIKLINNMLFTVNMAATGEAMALGIKAGVDPTMLREVMNSSSGRSYALDIKVRDFVLPRNFEPGFSVELQAKDSDLAIELARNLGVPVIFGSLVRQMYQTLIIKGHAKKDTSIIVTLFEELLGSGEIKA